MASLSKEAPKKWRVQWMDIAGTGKRKQLRMSGLTRKQAEGNFARIESIISTRLQGAKLDDVDAAWLGSLPDQFHTRLAKAGLVEPRVVEETEPVQIVLLYDFVDEFINDGKTARGSDAAESTIMKWRTTRDALKHHFDDVDISMITPVHAKRFRQWLERRKVGRGQTTLSENARRKHIATVKLFFNAAVRLDLIPKNPFVNEVSGTVQNRTRDFFVTAEMTTKLIDAAPDAQWRLLIALWRLAGLRKMEVFHLSWNDVLWDQGKVRVHIPKTKHHEGKEIRYVPIGDILPYLEAAFEEAEPGTDRVITRYNKTNVNLHKPFLKIVENAGLVPWPKLFQNLRSSCETEWLDSGLPAHVVANWMGHSVKVQNDSYAQVHQTHFDEFV